MHYNSVIDAPSTIDLHAHWVPPSVTDRPEYIAGRVVLHHEGSDLGRMLEELAETGCDAAMLSPWPVLLAERFAGDESKRLMEVQNEAIARAAQDHRGRVWGCGTVQLNAGEVAARQLEDLMGVPGMVGVEITPVVDGVVLGDDRFDSFWAVAEATQALVFLHPATNGLDLPYLQRYHLSNSVGNPTETAVFAAHMVFSGRMQKYPRLKVMLAHGGGSVPSIRGRLRHAAEVNGAAQERVRGDVDDLLRKFYYDTITHDHELLRQLVSWAGPDRVLLGSDYPADMAIARPAEFVREAGLGELAESMVLRDNARGLIAGQSPAP